MYALFKYVVRKLQERNFDINLGKKVLEKSSSKPKQIKSMTVTPLEGLQRICCHGVSM